MNEEVVGYCRAAGIEVTRSRAYKKNDQAHVEQKNGAIVRRLLGYGRFSGLAAAQTLARLFAASRLHVNVFQPSFKLISKTRIGARVKKVYDIPRAPLDRAVADARVDASCRQQLLALRARLDPIVLISAIRTAQADLGQRIEQRTSIVAQKRESNELDRFAQNLGAAWRAGEVRPTHQRAKRTYVRRMPRPPRRRQPHHVQLAAWLDAEPHLNGPALLQRLRVLDPARYGALSLRTIQREMRRWRVDAVRALIDAAALSSGPSLRRQKVGNVAP